MIQRPKTTPSGLREDDHKVLVSELTKYAQEGATDDELKEFRESFISEKKKSIQSQKDGTKAPLSSTTPTESVELAPKDGSLDTAKPPKFRLEGQKTTVPETEQKNLYDLKQNKPEEVVVVFLAVAYFIYFQIIFPSASTPP